MIMDHDTEEAQHEQKPYSSLLECCTHLSDRLTASRAQLKGGHTCCLRYAGRSRRRLALYACCRLGKVLRSCQVSQPPSCEITDVGMQAAPARQSS